MTRPRKIREDLKKVKKIKKEDDHKINVACLAVEIKSNGEILTPTPLFFGHQEMHTLTEVEEAIKRFFTNQDHEKLLSAAVETHKVNLMNKLQNPHFFMSGRLSEKQSKDFCSRCSVGEIKDSPLSFLPETPTQEFLRLKELINDIPRLISALPEEYSFLKLLEQKSNKIDKDFYQKLSLLERGWLERIQLRSNQVDSGNLNDMFNYNYMSILKAKFKSNLIQNQEVLENGEKKDEQDEGLFTHSEQLFLVRLQNELEDFLKTIIFICDIHKPIDEIIFHIPTWNTMCARCSLSTLIDFEGENGISSKINQYLIKFLEHYPTYAGIRPEKPIKSTIFVAAHKRHKTVFRNKEGDIRDEGEKSWDFDFSEVHMKKLYILQVLIENLPNEGETIAQVQSTRGFNKNSSITNSPREFLKKEDAEDGENSLSHIFIDKDQDY